MGKRSVRLIAGAAAAVLAALLLLPDGRGTVPEGAGEIPFVWDRDEMWRGLERRFAETREEGCEAVRDEISASLASLEARLAALGPRTVEAGDGELALLERELFDLAPRLAACPERLADFIAFLTRLRAVVKDLSRGWDAGSKAARDRVYRLLYGGRTALEEVLLQLPRDHVEALVHGIDEPSATPSAEHYGVRVHSGDILVSRGGAPTSALIARGNDYPGNFSHVALVHVDEASREVKIVEAHIEAGVVVASLDEYMAAKKLRILVLRPRADLPRLAADPFLPHRAASRALAEARGRHVPYDFEMDYLDPSRQFCSEVASGAYRELGVELWEGLTSMSSRGVTAWLAALGVRHFTTHGPSDLEYDPKLRVVAEWRDPETLWDDHVDNAVLDVLLEGAEAGEKLSYSWPALPLARLAKGWSWTLNLAGRLGPVPEGMTATVALRVRWLTARHAAVKERTLELAAAFEAERGYVPPYWALVDLARRAKSEIPG